MILSRSQSGPHSAVVLTAMTGPASAGLCIRPQFILSSRYQLFQLPAGDMKPTIEPGDYLVSDKGAPLDRINCDIIAVFRNSVREELLIKRVVGALLRKCCWGSTARIQQDSWQS